MNCNATVTRSSRIPSVFVLVWMLCFWSGFAKVKRGEEVLDLGTGTGIIPILLEAKTEGQHFTGLEIQPESADMAARSVAYNHLEDRVSIVTGDIKDATNIFGASSFDVVTCNPPYMTDQHGIKNDGDAKTIARHEVLCNLEDVVSQTAKLLRPGGRCYFVHRPFRLVEILSTMSRYKVEPKRMQLVYPYVDKEPNMVLIEGMRGRKVQDHGRKTSDRISESGRLYAGDLRYLRLLNACGIKVEQR